MEFLLILAANVRLNCTSVSYVASSINTFWTRAQIFKDMTSFNVTSSQVFTLKCGSKYNHNCVLFKRKADRKCISHWKLFHEIILYFYRKKMTWEVITSLCFCLLWNRFLWDANWIATIKFSHSIFQENFTRKIWISQTLIALQ